MVSRIKAKQKHWKWLTPLGSEGGALGGGAGGAGCEDGDGRSLCILFEGRACPFF